MPERKFDSFDAVFKALQPSRPFSEQITLAEIAEEKGAAYRVAEKLVGGGNQEEDGEGTLKMAQLRRFFREIKELKRQGVPAGKHYERLVRLKPLLAYASARKVIPPDFYKLMSLCISREMLKEPKDFDHFAEFLEAIVAYHKFISLSKNEKEVRR